MGSEDGNQLPERNHVSKDLIRLLADIITVILSFGDSTKELAARFYMVVRESIGSYEDESITIPNDATETIHKALKNPKIQPSELDKYSPSDTEYGSTPNRDSLN